MLSRLSILSCLAVLVAGCAIGGSTPTSSVSGEHASAISGWLHTDGMRIVDEQGNTVVLRGVNASGMEYGVGDHYQQGVKPRGWQSFPATMYSNLHEWGFNAIRVPLAWANIEPSAPDVNPDGSLTHYYNEEYLAAMDTIVQRARDQHLAVILDNHHLGLSPAFSLDANDNQDSTGAAGAGMPIWLYANRTVKKGAAYEELIHNTNGQTDLMIAAWQMVAQRYAADPTVVGIELLNEPTSLYRPDDLTAFYEKVGAGLQSVNPHLLIAIEDLNQADPALTTAPSLSNVVYSYHDYTSTTSMAISRLHSHLATAQKMNLPVWVGEFARPKSASDSVGSDADGTSLASVLAAFHDDGVSWTYWAYQLASHPLPSTSGRGGIDDALVMTLQQGL